MGLFNLRGDALQLLIAFIGATAFLLQGYNQSMMNGFLTLGTFIEQIPEVNTLTTTGVQKAHNATIQGLVVAIYELGCAFGALSCVVIGDKLGRPKSMLVAGIIATIGTVINASTYSLGQIIAGRIIAGFGVGIYTGTVPMYVSEVASAKHRGQLVLIEGVFALGGIALAGWVNFGFYYVKGAVNWRFPISLPLLFIAVLLASYPLLPESPRWLIKQDRLEDGAAVISRLRDLDRDSTKVAQEAAVIRAALLKDAGHRHTYSTNPFSMNRSRHLNRTVLACLGTIITQMTGINILPFYSNTILETTLGYSGSTARIISGCLQVTLALGGLTAIFVVEKVGRRRLMLFSTSAMLVSQAVVAGLSSNLSNPASGKAALCFYFLGMYCLPIGMFIIPFMYASEIAPLGIRHKVAAMASASSWLFNFMVAEVTPVAFAHISWRYYIVYACCSAAGVVVIYFFFPETEGRSLEEIDLIFTHATSALDVVKVAKTLPKDLDVLQELEHSEKEASVNVDEV